MRWIVCVMLVTQAEAIASKLRIFGWCHMDRCLVFGEDPCIEAVARAAPDGVSSGGGCGVKIHCPSPSTLHPESWSTGLIRWGR